MAEVVDRVDSDGGRRRLIFALLAAAAAGLVVIIVLLTLGGCCRVPQIVAMAEQSGGQLALYQQRGEVGPDPFMTFEDRAEVTGLPALPTDPAVGLYGGSLSNTCDPDALIAYLAAHPDKAKAWAGVHGIPVASIPTFVGSLTPMILQQNTLVINHGFKGGVANAFPAVLQAGTAVLVDSAGVPRARCFCGNPLTTPDDPGCTVTRPADLFADWQDVESPIVGHVDPGNPVVVLEFTTNDDGGLGARILLEDGTIGWIIADALSEDCVCIVADSTEVFEVWREGAEASGEIAAGEVIRIVDFTHDPVLGLGLFAEFADGTTGWVSAGSLTASTDLAVASDRLRKVAVTPGPVASGSTVDWVITLDAGMVPMFGDARIAATYVVEDLLGPGSTYVAGSAQAPAGWQFSSASLPSGSVSWTYSGGPTPTTLSSTWHPEPADAVTVQSYGTLSPVGTYSCYSGGPGWRWDAFQVMGLDPADWETLEVQFTDQAGQVVLIVDLLGSPQVDLSSFGSAPSTLNYVVQGRPKVGIGVPGRLLDQFGEVRFELSYQPLEVIEFCLQTTVEVTGCGGDLAVVNAAQFLAGDMLVSVAAKALAGVAVIPTVPADGCDCEDPGPDDRPGEGTSSTTSTGDSTTSSQGTSTSTSTTAVTDSTRAEARGEFCVTGTAWDDALNVRSGPGTNNPVIGTLPFYATGIFSTGAVQQAGSIVWYEIAFGSGVGWVASHFLEPAPCGPIADFDLVVDLVNNTVNFDPGEWDPPGPRACGEGGFCWFNGSITDRVTLPIDPNAEVFLLNADLSGGVGYLPPITLVQFADYLAGIGYSPTIHHYEPKVAGADGFGKAMSGPSYTLEVTGAVVTTIRQNWHP